MSHVDHMEVAPRMWDKTIAAAYTPTKDKSISNEALVDTNATFVGGTTSQQVVDGLSVFDKLKMYLIPALLVIGIIVSIYILWKYFTIYRNNKNAIKSAPEVITEAEISPPTIDPQHLVKTEDLSKYEYDSDDEDKLPKIEELPELEDPEDVEESDATSDEDSNSDDGEEEEEKEYEHVEQEAPNILEIEQLINESKFDMDNMAMLEDNELFDIPETPQPVAKPKRAGKKTTRITL